MSWAIGRRDRDLLSTAKGQAGRSRQARGREAQGRREGQGDEKAKADDEEAEEAEAKPEADADARTQPKSREDNPAKEREAKKPYVDRQLDKALEVLKEKLATPVAKK